jgi:hypothetical protein
VIADSIRIPYQVEVSAKVKKGKAQVWPTHSVRTPPLMILKVACWLMV